MGLVILLIAVAALATRFLNGAPHWDSVSMSGPSTYGLTQVEGISCTSSDFCMAAGTYSNVKAYRTGFTERWDGTTWTLLPNPAALVEAGSFSLNAIDCVSPSFCIAVGQSGESALTEEWNGSGWAQIVDAEPSNHHTDVLDGVSCASVSMCVAVGGDYSAFLDAISGQPLSERWNGTTWQLLSSSTNANGYEYVGVSCATATSCMGIADPRYAEGFGSTARPYSIALSGTSWTRTALHVPSGERNYLTINSISCATQTSCVAAGSIAGGTPYRFPPGNAIPYTERWDGHVWTAGTSLVQYPNASFDSIECISTATCVAVGNTRLESSPNADGFTDIMDVEVSQNSLTSAGSGTSMAAVGCAASGFCITSGGSAAFPSRQTFQVESFRATVRFGADRFVALLVAAGAAYVSVALFVASWKRHRATTRPGVSSAEAPSP